MNAKSIVICGSYGAGNLGDDAILRALIQEFQAKGPITVISATPEATSREFQVKAVAPLPTGITSFLMAHLTKQGRQRLRETREVIHRASRFVLGGGTLLTDEPRRSLWIWGKHAEAAFRANVPVWIHRSGIGPLQTSRSKKWTRSILARAERVSVRDHESLQWAERLGCSTATLTRDPVFDYPLSFDRSASPEKTVIFCPRYWIKNMNNTTEAFSVFIRYLCLEKGMKVVGVPFEKSNQKDIQFLNKIFEQANVGNVATVWSTYRSERDVVEAIARAETMVGMRLHSLIFAEITHTPFIGIAYAEKVKALGKELGKEDQVIDLKTLTSEMLIEAYNALPKVSR